MSEIIICIDPGHGSAEYLGANYLPFIEKDMTLIVANALKQHLEKFDNVKVVMTRESDINVGLRERCDIAKSNNANYFFSIHFNSSANHDLYGSEVWLPVQSKYYNVMYPVANEISNSFQALGYFQRGIKTRAGSSGKDNYYAVIKHTSDYGIPACIIEHCHIDNLSDTKYLGADNINSYNMALMNFGIQDAEAIAKALHLKSTVLGEDYTSYKTANVKKSGLITQDYTAPEKCVVEVVNRNVQNSSITLKITAKDSNSWINYYRYSLDGGLTFSELLTWPKSNVNTSLDSTTVEVIAPNISNLNIIVLAYNAYDLYTQSNTVSVSESNLNVNQASIVENLNYGMLTKNNTVYNIDIFVSGAILIGLLVAILFKKIKK